MARTRVSTTVDSDVWERARGLRAWKNDASLLEEALRALLARDRAAEIDAAYEEAYQRIPAGTPDGWGGGDLESWSEAISRLPRDDDA